MLLVALVVGPTALGVLFLGGALLPSSGPGAGSGGPTVSITITEVLSWLQVVLSVLVAAGGWELGVRASHDEDRTWAIGARLVGGLAVVGSLGVAVGLRAAPQVDWDTISVAGPPIGAALALVLGLLTVERLRLVGAAHSARHAERGVWALGVGSLLLLDGLVPERASLDTLLGPGAAMAALALVGASIYGAVLLGGGLMRLARDDGDVVDLSANDG
jgi:hypothetical protein